MKLGLMSGETIPTGELRSSGFDAVQMFFSGGDSDPSPEDVDKILEADDVALAAMTLHVGLVNERGTIQTDVERLVECVERTADLESRFGDNECPLLIWHPSEYPSVAGVDDNVVFQGLCQALSSACTVAEDKGVHIAVEITRAGSIGSAESFLRVKDQVGSSALRVCMDAANFVPDRTPLERAVRMLGPEIAIAHAKDSWFSETGLVADYGPVGSGCLDYPTYLRCLQKYTNVPYLVFEYYLSRDDLLKARDIVKDCLP